MREELINLFKQAEKDFDVAEKNFKLKEYYVVAFFCQQSVEKALKTLLMKNKKKLIKTHSISKMAKLVGVPKKLNFKIAELEPVYQESRYPDVSEGLPYEKYEEQDVIEFLNTAEEVLTWIEHKVK